MKITVLSDNSINAEKPLLKSEWGLSLHIEFHDKKLLFDTGASSLFLQNAIFLGISIADVEYAVISHAHFDHANGIPAFCAVNKKAEIIVREEFDENCYKRDNYGESYIGITKGTIEAYPERIRRVRGVYKISESVYVYPNSSNVQRYADSDCSGFLINRHGNYISDGFQHEQSLILDDSDGLVIINGCSHTGIVPVINGVLSTFPKKPIKGYIGGLHLFREPDVEIKSIAEDLNKGKVRKIYAGHCTGEGAIALLDKYLKSDIKQYYLGEEISI